jgi:hypothetical protein
MGIIGRRRIVLRPDFAALRIRLFLSPPIWHHGEAREGLVVREIGRDRQWTLPFRNGSCFFGQ